MVKILFGIGGRIILKKITVEIKINKTCSRRRQRLLENFSILFIRNLLESDK